METEERMEMEERMETEDLERLQMVVLVGFVVMLALLTVAFHNPHIAFSLFLTVCTMYFLYEVLFC